MNETRLLLASVKALEDPRLFAELYAAVSPARQEKINKLRFDSDKRLSLGAAVLLRQLLREAGLIPEELRFCPDANGKPRCVSRPEAHISLSHSGEYAMAALSPCEVGCDVEQWRDPAPLEVARRFFAPAEAGLLARLPAEEQSRSFFRLWTLKESLAKATGAGLTAPFDSLTPDISARPAAFPREKNGPVAVCEPELIPGYACACCALQPPPGHSFVWALRELGG